MTVTDKNHIKCEGKEDTLHKHDTLKCTGLSIITSYDLQVKGLSNSNKRNRMFTQLDIQLHEE